jgi:hypothetical protein
MEPDAPASRPAGVTPSRGNRKGRPTQRPQVPQGVANRVRNAGWARFEDGARTSGLRAKRTRRDTRGTDETDLSLRPGNSPNEPVAPRLRDGVPSTGEPAARSGKPRPATPDAEADHRNREPASFAPPPHLGALGILAVQSLWARQSSRLTFRGQAPGGRMPPLPGGRPFD